MKILYKELLLNKYLKIKPKTCETSLLWILNYRQKIKSNSIINWTKIDIANFVLEEQHNLNSFNWTINQSNIIDKKGFDYWYNNTEGRYGYLYYSKKYMKKFE